MQIGLAQCGGEEMNALNNQSHQQVLLDRYYQNTTFLFTTIYGGACCSHILQYPAAIPSEDSSSTHLSFSQFG